MTLGTLSSVLLGCCIVDASCVDKAVEAGLTAEHFETPEQRMLWEAFVDQRVAGKPLELLSLMMTHEAKCHIETFMAAENSAPTTLHFKDALEGLLWAFTRQKLHAASTNLTACITANGNRETVGAAISAIQEAAGARDNKAADIATVSQEVEATFRDALEGKPDLRRTFPFPFEKLSSVFGPIYDHEFILVAARPSVGKTSFCVQQATECCRKGYNVAYIATEASAAQIISQMASQEARVNLRELDRQMPENLKKAMGVVSRIRESKKLRIYDRDLSITAIKHRCRMLAGWADIVFIDHLAQISNPGKSRYESVSDTCHQMVEIQKILGCPLVLAHQLKRLEQNGVPGLQDLRDSGAAEEDASRIILIHFPNEDFAGIPQVGLDVPPRDTRDYYVIQAKHRYGMRDVTARAKYHAPTTRFTQV